MSETDKDQCEVCHGNRIEFVDGGHGNVVETPCSKCGSAEIDRAHQSVSGQAAINKIIDEDPVNNWWLEEDAFEGWK